MKFRENKRLTRILSACLTVVFVVSIGVLIHKKQEYSKGKEIYEDISKQVIVSKEEKELVTEEETKAVPNFEKLYEINSHTTGWICIEGTNIDYPIAHGENNEYYLKHAFTGEINAAGSIFLDYRNTGDFSDLNNIIYGHHMKNGTMFSDLDVYKTKIGYEKYPKILLRTPQKTYKIEIFSAYVADVTENAWKTEFHEGEYEKWLMEVKEKSMISTSVMPEKTDITVTLSTCSYEFENARLVVMGILKEAEA